MPCFRGIDISIHASLEAKRVTEYPHPDGSSVRLLRATAPIIRNSAPELNSPSTAGDADPTHLKKVNPRMSVYIPSLPGEQFWIRYSVNESPPPSRCMFFKLYMNGHHISSWGINVNTCSTGVVVRALYQPTHHEWEDGCVPNEAHYPGIETRSFQFMPGPGGKSAAEDGGLIEVQVFRCKGRKRIALELDSYRNQERYGITSPSGGLVDNPEDATYYNYYLIDPKDAPFATFSFHYRSMKYLKQLNLIPQSELNSSPESNSSCGTQKDQSAGVSRSDATSSLARRFTFDSFAPDSRVFDNNIGTEGKDVPEREGNSLQGEYFLKSPPAFSPYSLRCPGPESSNSDINMDHSSGSQQRPLPEIPDSPVRPSSASSLRSNCPSLTPSLRQYVESDDFENEDISLNTAQPMLIKSESMQGLELVGTDADEGVSISDYETSPSSSEPTHSPKLPSPTGYIPTTGSVLERQLTQYDSLAPDSPPSRTRIPSLEIGTQLGTNQAGPRAGVLDLTEAEWLRHTPSPAQQMDQRAGVVEGACPKSFTEEAPTASEDNAPDMALRDHTVKNHLGENDQTPVGNWI